MIYSEKDTLTIKKKINRDKPKICVYTKKYKDEKEKQRETIKRRQQRENVNKQFKDKEEMLEIDDKKLIYPNQKEAADKCIQAYNDGALLVMLVAQPGTGKTGTAQEVMRVFATNDDDEKFIPNENIIVCSGMSDNDWETQFKDNLIDSFKENVFHRQNFSKQQEKLKIIKNSLIIPDECHIASGSKMTIAKTLQNAGLLDIEILRYRKIKMLDISATPESVLYDSNEWGNKVKVVKIEPGPIYKGFEVMLKENRIIEAPILNTYEKVLDFLSFLDKRYSISSKKYFPIRLLDENIKLIITDICEELEWAEPLIHDSESRIEDIDEIMKTSPEKHTIIFIKGFWRASKRVIREHVGATYEPVPKKQDMTSTSQGLTARFCDNYEYEGDQLDINKRPLHFCDKDAIEKYVKWFNNDCDFSKSEYKSHRIKSNGKGKVISKHSKVHESIVQHLHTETNKKFDLNDNFESKNNGYKLFFVGDKDDAEIEKECKKYTNLPKYRCINKINTISKVEFIEKYGQYWIIETKHHLTLDALNNYFKEIGKECHKPNKDENGNYVCCLADEKLKKWDYDELYNKLKNYGDYSTHGIHNGLKNNKKYATRAWVGYDKDGNVKYTLKKAIKTETKQLPFPTNEITKNTTYLNKNPYIVVKENVKYSILKDDEDIADLSSKYYWRTLDGWLYLSNGDK